MKLGEALARRSELQSHISGLRERLAVSTLVQEGDSPPENPAELIADLDKAANELEALITAINRTNSETEVGPGMTATAALARRDVLGLRHSVLKAAADATAMKQARYSRSEIRTVRTLDIGELRAQLDQLASERRLLDADIQAANWTVDLVDDNAK